MINSSFKKSLISLLTKKCVSVIGGGQHGPQISFVFGGKDPFEKTNLPQKESPTPAPSHEFMIAIYCPWRIESSEKVLCGSHGATNSDDSCRKCSNLLVGKVIETVECNSPAKDLKIGFEGGISLDIHCSDIGNTNEECYLYFAPKKTYTVNFDGGVMEEAAEKARQLQ